MLYEFNMLLTLGLSEVSRSEIWVRTASPNQIIAFMFFSEEKKPKAQLNFHENKFLRRRLSVRRTRGSPDFFKIIEFDIFCKELRIELL